MKEFAGSPLPGFAPPPLPSRTAVQQRHHVAGQMLEQHLNTYPDQYTGFLLALASGFKTRQYNTLQGFNYSDNS